MIKMQIVMDDSKIALEGKYDREKLHASIDGFLVSRLGFRKGDNGFYYGSGSGNDYSRFGIAMTTLGKKRASATGNGRDIYLSNPKATLRCTT